MEEDKSKLAKDLERSLDKMEKLLDKMIDIVDKHQLKDKRKKEQECEFHNLSICLTR